MLNSTIMDHDVDWSKMLSTLVAACADDMTIMTTYAFAAILSNNSVNSNTYVESEVEYGVRKLNDFIKTTKSRTDVIFVKPDVLSTSNEVLVIPWDVLDSEATARAKLIMEAVAKYNV